MRYLFIFLMISILSLSSAQTAFAQQDEIVVTGSRINVQDRIPGVFLVKKGDFLLLEVSVINDSRDSDLRFDEMMKTLDVIMAAADKDPSIELSLIDDNSRVRPLSKQAYRSGIRQWNRPDSSIVTLKVKTPIPNTVLDSYKLSTKLINFVENIKGVGRTDLVVTNDVSVSIINPQQYRGELLGQITSEMKSTTGQIGPDYRVIVDGLDRQMSWVRDGDLNLAFYVPYSYRIVPTSLESYSVTLSEDY